MTAARTCYLIGPVTGQPLAAREEFAAAQTKLEAEGWTVRNPMAHPRSAECTLESERLGENYADGPVYCSLMRDFVRWICESDAAFVLPGWHMATGATAEVFVATRIGVPVIHFKKRRRLRVSFDGMLARIAVAGPVMT